MKRQITEHPPDNRRASRLQSTDYRMRKKNLGSGFWALGSKNGFTLIELMIAITITALAMTAVYTSYIVQRRSFTTQDQVAETQISSRIAFNMLVNDIRNAGFGIPENPDINTFIEVVTLTNNAGGLNNSDEITLISGFRHIADTGLSAAELLGGQTTLRVSQRDGQNRPYVDICYTGSVQFDIANMQYLSIDGVTYAEVIAIDTANVDCNFNGVDETAATTVARLILSRDIDKSFPVNINRSTPIYLIEDVTYGIDLQGNSTSDFERAGQAGMPTATITVANNIDDFQIVKIDEDGDGITDRLRINILAHTANEDQTLDPATKPYAGGITLEDQPTAIGAGDQFRRRIWSMEVASRNSWE